MECYRSREALFNCSREVFNKAREKRHSGKITFLRNAANIGEFTKYRAHKALCKPTPSRRTEGSDSIGRAKYTCSFEIRACRSEDDLGVGFPRGIKRGSKFRLPLRKMSRITIITRTSNKWFLPLPNYSCNHRGHLQNRRVPSAVLSFL